MNATQRQPIFLAPGFGHPLCLRRLVLIFLTLLACTFAASPLNVRAQEEEIIQLEDARQGQSYLVQVATAGTAPFNWALLQGAYPPGITPAADGTLTGIPTAHQPDPYVFKVSVTDSSAAPRMATQWLSIKVAPPQAPPLIAPPGTRVPVRFTLTTSTADEETIALTQTLPALSPTPNSDPDTSAVNMSSLQAMIAGSIGTSTRNFREDDYCVMHVIMWKPVNAEGKSEPRREIWALFKARAHDANNVRWEPQIDPKDENLFATRIFGQKRVAVLLVHLQTPAAWDVKYKVAINQKVPTPFQHVLDLVSSAILAVDGGAAPQPKNIWGARMMLIKYESSELVVKVNAVTTGPDGPPVEQSKEHTNTFVNEGKYHWDVSVGLPVRSVRELRFKSDGNRVFAESKEKQSVYGFLNLYPKAVDLKSDDFFTVPHIVLGVPLASKPLHRPFVGVGAGVFKMPIKFNVFGGVVFNRERVPATLGEGSTATTSQLEADLRTRWVRKFMFGINLPVSQIKDAIKSN
jgi:Putative Ig domain